jgi:hypothetical protein
MSFCKLGKRDLSLIKRLVRCILALLHDCRFGGKGRSCNSRTHKSIPRRDTKSLCRIELVSGLQSNIEFAGELIHRADHPIEILALIASE